VVENPLVIDHAEGAGSVQRKEAVIRNALDALVLSLGGIAALSELAV